MDPATPRCSRIDARTDSPRRRLRAQLRLIAAASLLLLTGLSGVDGTYAMWREQADIAGPAIESGTSSLTVEWDSGTEHSSSPDLLPGDSVTQRATVTNTGDVPVSLSGLVDAPTPGLEFRVVGGDAQTPLTSSTLGAKAQPIRSSVASGAALVLGPGQSAGITVEHRATEDLAPGADVAFEVIIEGTQAP